MSRMFDGTGNLSHDALAQSLAGHLRSSDRMVWCDMQLGPSGSPRPDVYTIFKSFAHPAPMAYECKVSTADFRADVTAGKWQTYLPFSTGVVFACEAGLVTKHEVPEHCGLIVLTGDSWRMAKRPVLRPVIVPQDALLKLIIDGVEREGPRYRARYWSDSVVMTKLAHRFGEVTARTIRDRLAVEHEIEDRTRQAERILADAQRRAEELRKEAVTQIAPIRDELCAVLGLEPTAGRWQIERAVAQIRQALAEHPAHERLRRLTQSVLSAVERDGFKEPQADSEVHA